MFKTIDRLMQFINYAGLSARQFDLSIGAGNGYTLRMQKNNASIGSDVIESIVKTYPQLNLVWLITGEGEMINPGVEPILISKRHKNTSYNEIERIIESKIRARQEKELKILLQEVTAEIEKNQKKLSNKK